MHKKKNLKHCGDSSKNDANMKSNEKGFTLDLLKKNMGITTVHSLLTLARECLSPT